MAGAGGTDGIDGNTGITIGTVFEADRAGERGGHFPVDLAFGGTRADSTPAYQVGNKLSGHHIEKFGGGGDPQLVDLQQQPTCQLKTVIHSIAALRSGSEINPFQPTTVRGFSK
ncbi:Uncharacterised protein [Raoultella ornithinolytica]|nr:Uncharacterised protein [Raoultella ornithinolytica]